MTLMMKQSKWSDARAMRAYCQGSSGQMGQGDGSDTSNLDARGETELMNGRMSAEHAAWAGNGVRRILRSEGVKCSAICCAWIIRCELYLSQQKLHARRSNSTCQQCE